MQALTQPQIRAIDTLLMEVRQELVKAMVKHPTFPTAHHGMSVIDEEVFELREHVYADTATMGPAKKEAIQIAAMGMRFALDLCQ